MLGRTAARLTATIAMAAGFGLVAATTAGAHECFNTSRSAQGSAMASKSQAWETFAIADFIAQDVENGLYDAETGECILETYLAAGGPATFTFHVKNAADGVVGTDRNGHAADGHGIDWAFPSYGDIIFGAFAQCGVEF